MSPGGRISAAAPLFFTPQPWFAARAVAYCREDVVFQPVQGMEASCLCLGQMAQGLPIITSEDFTTT